MSKPAEDLLRVESKIASYLEKNPEFFDRHPELLENLKINHKVYGSVSLVERQILNLRQRSETLQARLSEMMDNAQINSDLLIKCSEIAVDLIREEDKQQMINVLQKHLTHFFDIDDCQIWLSNEEEAWENAQYSDTDTLKQLTDHQFFQVEAVCGRMTDGVSQLFKSDKTLHSYALIPLGDGAELGLIALGSHNVELFTADMGTLFLRFIGDVFEACLVK